MNSQELRESYGKSFPKTEEFALRSAIAMMEQRLEELVGPSSFDDVVEFHETYGHPVADEPTLLTDERFAFRLRLIEEELKEFIESVEQGDLVNAAKELADIKYVVNGMAAEMGLPFDEVFKEVHRSNMSKLGADGKPIYRDDGKVLKGPYYSEANIAPLLGS